MTDPASRPLPAIAELRADDAWRSIEFISDLHLSEDTPLTFAAFARYLRHTDADAVFILGDLFEAWIGDDASDRGFEAQCAALLAEASKQHVIGFMHGNRDFLVGAELLESCGVIFLSDPTVLCAFGQRVLLSHGDALCLSDTAYQRFRAIVRDTEWQRAFLARPLDERRNVARQLREESRQLKSRHRPGEWFDVDADEALRWMREAATPVLIHGHTHMPGSNALAAGFQRHVLSDWDLDHPHAAPRAEVVRWQPGGLARIAPP